MTTKNSKEPDDIAETINAACTSLLKIKLDHEDISTKYARPIWNVFNNSRLTLEGDGKKLEDPAGVLLDLIMARILQSTDCSEDEALGVAALWLAVYALNLELEGGNEDSASDD